MNTNDDMAQSRSGDLRRLAQGRGRHRRRRWSVPRFGYESDRHRHRRDERVADHADQQDRNDRQPAMDGVPAGQNISKSPEQKRGAQRSAGPRQAWTEGSGGPRCDERQDRGDEESNAEPGGNSPDLMLPSTAKAQSVLEQVSGGR